VETLIVLNKVLLSIVAIVIGIVLFGIAKEILGFGSVIVAGLLVYALYEIWTAKVYEKNSKGINTDTKSAFHRPTVKTFPKKTTLKKPSPKPKSEDFKMKEKIDITLNENELYEQVWREIEENKTDLGLWAKCFSTCEGDENKTKALYVSKRVLVLKEELKKQKIDQERKIKETVKKLLVAKWKTDNMEIFKETLDTMPNFFPKLLDQFGYKLVQNKDKQEMWSIHLPSGTGTQMVYNLHDLRIQVSNILEKEDKIT